MSKEYQDPIVHLVEQGLHFLIFILILYASFTLLLLIYNKIYWRYYQRTQRQLTRSTIFYLLDPTVDSPQTDVLSEHVLRDVLIDLVLVMKGAEREILYQLYVKQGLWEKDLHGLKDRRWHVRLESLIRMDLWKKTIKSDLVRPLIEDSNRLVRQVALKNLSRTSNKNEARLIIEILQKAIIHHYSQEYGIINRMIDLHTDIVVEGLVKHPAAPISSTIIQVLGDKRILSSVPLLINFAQEGQTSAIRESALISLGKIEDPRGLNTLINALDSDEARERLAALKSLVLVDKTVFQRLHSQLINDPDPLVAGWVHYLNRVES